MTKEANGTTDLIVLGLNEDGKPVAARFPATQRDLVEKAAKAMNLTVCKAESAALAELASKLPTGRLYATGRGFVPPMRKDQYSQARRAAERLQASWSVTRRQRRVPRSRKASHLPSCQKPGTRSAAATWWSPMKGRKSPGLWRSWSLAKATCSL